MKWARENELLPLEQQRKLPERPTVAINSDNWNEFAWKASQDALIPCPNCKRTFAADRLPIHARTCKSKTSSRPSSASSTSSSSNRPRTVLCYICGREFGTKSVSIHEPQCLNKWRQQNMQLPVKLRQTEPVKPESSDIQSIWTSHLDSLVGCRKCNRKFFPERIERHEEVCSHVLPPTKISPRK